MSTRRDPFGAAAAGPGPRRAAAPSPYDRLRRLSDRMDALMRDAGEPARSHREHERRVNEAESIADGLRGVFRRPTSAWPVNPPLHLDEEQGRAAW